MSCSSDIRNLLARSNADNMFSPPLYPKTCHSDITVRTSPISEPWRVATFLYFGWKCDTFDGWHVSRRFVSYQWYLKTDVLFFSVLNNSVIKFRLLSGVGGGNNITYINRIDYWIFRFVMGYFKISSIVMAFLPVKMIIRCYQLYHFKF